MIYYLDVRVQLYMPRPPPSKIETFMKRKLYQARLARRNLAVDYDPKMMMKRNAFEYHARMMKRIHNGNPEYNMRLM